MAQEGLEEAMLSVTQKPGHGGGALSLIFLFLTPFPDPLICHSAPVGGGEEETVLDCTLTLPLSGGKRSQMVAVGNTEQSLVR